ncbi:MAG: RluA family pseudouridine synthase [Clostridia bacterium]|nr:RluA family pseudouridine synthase [Clostridia bacterium]
MQFTVSEEQEGRLLSALVRESAPDLPPWALEEALKRRDVRVDGVKTGSDVYVRAGQEIRVFFPKAALENAAGKKLPPPDIVFEDDRVLLIDKPQGLASQNEDDPLSGDTALTRALKHLRDAGQRTDHVHLCHRLDVQTGGLLLFVKDDEAYEAALKAFSERTNRKFYVCRVKGCPSQEEAVMRAYLRKDAEIARVSVTDYPARGAQQIVTAYRLLERQGDLSRLEVELITGRTHQIRAHLAHIGHPILGDDKYGDRALNRRMGVRRQQLWATKLVLHTGGALAYLDGRCFEVRCPF